MPTRSADAVWNGPMPKGDGTMRLGAGAWEGPYSFSSRFEEGEGTNPEELIGAAHAGCFSMALSAKLTEASHPPRRVHTTARVRLDSVPGGFAITRIDLETDADVPGLDDASFQKYAEAAKTGCPVSKALTGTQIELKATLRSST